MWQIGFALTNADTRHQFYTYTRITSTELIPLHNNSSQKIYSSLHISQIVYQDCTPTAPEDSAKIAQATILTTDGRGQLCASVYECHCHTWTFFNLGQIKPTQLCQY